MIYKLQQLGLSPKQAELYFELLKSGQVGANDIAKRTSSNRTVAYNVLQQLVDKGIVTYIKKENKKIFSIASPESLLKSVKERESVALDIINEIKKYKTQTSSVKNVEVYEGIEGMKSVFEEIKKARDLRVINATGLIFEYLKFSAGHIVKEIELKGNPKVIAVQSMKKTPLGKHRKIKFKYLPKEAENLATTFIFDNKVIIQVLKDNPFLIKIENKEIAEGYRNDFDVLWQRL